MLGALALSLAIASAVPIPVVAQVDPDIRDRIIPAASKSPSWLDVTEGDTVESQYLPIGSGTVISPDGLILTNWHVVDMAELQKQLDLWETQAAYRGETLAFDLDTQAVLILVTEGIRPAEPRYLAHVEAHDENLDLAVLRIVSDENGDLEPRTSISLLCRLGTQTPFS